LVEERLAERVRLRSIVEIDLSAIAEPARIVVAAARPDPHLVELELLQLDKQRMALAGVGDIVGAGQRLVVLVRAAAPGTALVRQKRERLGLPDIAGGALYPALGIRVAAARRRVFGLADRDESDLAGRHAAAQRGVGAANRLQRLVLDVIEVADQVLDVAGVDVAEIADVTQLLGREVERVDL